MPIYTHTRTDIYQLNPAPARYIVHSAHLLRFFSRPQLRYIFTAEVERAIPVSHVSCVSNAFLARLHAAPVLIFLDWGYKLWCKNLITAFAHPNVQESYLVRGVTCSYLEVQASCPPWSFLRPSLTLCRLMPWLYAYWKSSDDRFLWQTLQFIILSMTFISTDSAMLIRWYISHK